MPKGCKLRALDVVYTPNIPFYLVAGPALGVSTNNAATEEFFSRILLGGDQGPPRDDENNLPLWWQRQLQQFEYGILLKVDHGAIDCSTAATEILVYAAVDHSSNAWDGMLTPPKSSSPDIGGCTLTETRPALNSLCLKLYALPLDSRRLESLSVIKAEQLAGSAALGDGEARFLPLTGSQNPEAQQASHKRRKLSNVFDEANYQRRKIKGRGGESVSRAMAEASLQQPGKYVDNSASQPEKPIVAQQCINDQSMDIPRRSLSRVSSTSSLPSLDPSRPRSRRETFIAGKRSSLNRVESIISAPDSIVSGDSDNGFEQQNKSTLARIVMAGMRMYGLQQHKKPSQSQKTHQPPPLSKISTISSVENNPQVVTSRSPAAEEDPDPDEYKAIYHQTFKAASFTFRTQFALRLVAQESMREVVDRLLSLFCIDPYPDSSDTGKTATKDVFGSQEEAPRDVFDQPSSKQLREAVRIETPSSRRKPMR